ncbi:unnamed protein product [Peniophora sp. CBMAI 1063]|nr:unnamed protein product [Peniophora sp. CBMAI 1063]
MSRSGSPQLLSPLFDMPGAPRMGFLPFETFEDDAPVYLDAIPLVVTGDYQFYPSVFTPPPSPATLVRDVEQAGHMLQVWDEVITGESVLFSANPANYANHTAPTVHVHTQPVVVVPPTPPLSPVTLSLSFDEFDDGSSSSDESSIATPPSSPKLAPKIAIIVPDEPKPVLAKRQRDTFEEVDAPSPKRSCSAPPSPPRLAPRPRRLGATRSLNNIGELESSRSVGPTQGSTFPSI